MNPATLFKWRHFAPEVILYGVRWSLLLDQRAHLNRKVRFHSA